VVLMRVGVTHDRARSVAVTRGLTSADPDELTNPDH